MAIEWVNAKHSNYCFAKIGPGHLIVEVIPDSSTSCLRVPYRVVIFGATLKQRFTDREKAKTEAIKAAAKMLVAAVRNIERE